MKPLILIVFATITLGSCKKSKDAPAFTTENVKGKYTLGAIMFKMTGLAEQDITDQNVEECHQDDIMELKADLSYATEDAGTTCQDPGTDEGSWDIATSGKFVWDGDEYEVSKWDGSNLHITLKETDGDITVSTTFQFKKK